MTKAQRPDEPTGQQSASPLQTSSPGLQRSYTTATVTTQNHSPYTLASGSSSRLFTPPPQYQEPPSSIRPLYYAEKDAKTSMSTHEHYPPQTAGSEPWSRNRSNTPFWRTKKGIVLIVLLSNVIILAIVLGVVFASRSHRSKNDNDNSSGDSSQDSLSSNDQHGAPPPSSQSSNHPTSSSSSSLSTSSSSASASSVVSMLPVFSPLPPTSQPTGGTQATGNGNGVGAGSGKDPSSDVGIGGTNQSRA